MKIAYAGGSTPNNCSIGPWYYGNWDLYLDPLDPVLAEQAAKLAEQICTSGNFQCSLQARWSGYASILKHQGNIDQASGSFDCSSFVLSVYLLAGLDIDEAGYTGNMGQLLESTGLFRVRTDKTAVTTPSQAHRGGIYVNTNEFCVIALERGEQATDYTPAEITQAKTAYTAYQNTKKNLWKTTLRKSVQLIQSGDIEPLRYAKDGIFDLSGNLKRDPFEENIIRYGTTADGLEKIERSEPYLFYDQIPQTVINDVLGYEDRRFFSHRGYDLRGILRSLVNNLLGRSKQGASTITMQLTKILFINNYQRTIQHKLIQLYLAVLMEHHFTKQEILELYVNSLCLGNNCYGIAEAASFYFNKTADQLSVSECAYLTAISMSPGFNNPLKYPDHTEFYRKNRLKYIHLGGLLSDEAYASSLEEVPVLQLRREPTCKPVIYDEIYTVLFDRKTKTFQDSVETIYQRLKQNGFQSSVIAGILGNMHVESGFSPEAESPDGSIGLLQWERSRKQDLIQTFPDTWNTIDSQLDFLFMEADSSSPFADERFIQFVDLCKRDSSGTPEYYSDLFQALIERNASYDHMPDATTPLRASLKRFSPIPNAYNSRYYFDAPRRRNYSRIYADCIALREADEQAAD